MIVVSALGLRCFGPARQLIHRAVSGVFIGAGPVNGIGYIVFGYAVPGKLLSNLVGSARPGRNAPPR
ncbi:MAG: hypothetical protein K9L68_15170 [Spirochaetales bacterium]|nr:hypothetical protein [Spirochaetales bacterium]